MVLHEHIEMFLVTHFLPRIARPLSAFFFFFQRSSPEEVRVATKVSVIRRGMLAMCIISARDTKPKKRRT